MAEIIQQEMTQPNLGRRTFKYSNFHQNLETPLKFSIRKTKVLLILCDYVGRRKAKSMMHLLMCSPHGWWCPVWKESCFVHARLPCTWNMTTVDGRLIELTKPLALTNKQLAANFC